MTEQQEEMGVKLLSQGVSQYATAKTLGVTANAVQHFKKRNLERIQKETERFLEVLPDITDNTVRDIKTYNEISRFLAGKEPVENFNPAFKTKTVTTWVSKDGTEVKKEVEEVNNYLVAKFMTEVKKTQTQILQAIGILPGHTMTGGVINNHFNTLIQNNKFETINPSVLKAIGSHIQDITRDPDEESIEEELEDFKESVGVQAQSNTGIQTEPDPSEEQPAGTPDTE